MSGAAGGNAAALRAHVLSMYRSFLREARLMPTTNRRLFIETKVRRDFRAHAGESDPQELAVLLAACEAQLETAHTQRVLLNQLKAQGNLKGPK
mmetsp:Transcript_15284/g.38109  ORF Transcript_15284/g.38109 Transcript_15284/m.38109 type:complete len:94 (+) Transcript_15284:370-651(+)|eukprot:CAMPEP_0202857978 /NCGR_PEP_ID=MMETSP1391-20130828/701_1 /ASSEMBLY_ACC=CAM_ASM_000867 /TAXON_ID=1034604 /ORGANISM="Chlamydomonas leiostraca, Strain SAG 11-49" /LENGTH=93 /DNA_ID=CAMNT_0049536843 /DNA_START=326 /DNA_END=607 /DNA_ORIENTATION=-